MAKKVRGIPFSGHHQRHVERSEASCPQSLIIDVATIELVVAGKMLCCAQHDVLSEFG